MVNWTESNLPSAEDIDIGLLKARFDQAVTQFYKVVLNPKALESWDPLEPLYERVYSLQSRILDAYTFLGLQIQRDRLFAEVYSTTNMVTDTFTAKIDDLNATPILPAVLPAALFRADSYECDLPLLQEEIETPQSHVTLTELDNDMRLPIAEDCPSASVIVPALSAEIITCDADMQDSTSYTRGLSTPLTAVSPGEAKKLLVEPEVGSKLQPEEEDTSEPQVSSTEFDSVKRLPLAEDGPSASVIVLDWPADKDPPVAGFGCSKVEDPPILESVEDLPVSESAGTLQGLETVDNLQGLESVEDPPGLDSADNLPVMSGYSTPCITHVFDKERSKVNLTSSEVRPIPGHRSFCEEQSTPGFVLPVLLSPSVPAMNTDPPTSLAGGLRILGIFILSTMSILSSAFCWASHRSTDFVQLLHSSALAWIQDPAYCWAWHQTSTAFGWQRQNSALVWLQSLILVWLLPSAALVWRLTASSWTTRLTLLFGFASILGLWLASVFLGLWLASVFLGLWLASEIFGLWLASAFISFC